MFRNGKNAGSGRKLVNSGRHHWLVKRQDLRRLRAARPEQGPQCGKGEMGKSQEIRAKRIVRF